MFLTVVCLWEREISESLSLHQYVDGGPPEGSFSVSLWGCWKEKALFGLAVLLRQRFLVGLALSGGPAAANAMIHPNSRCLLISAAVFSSSAAQPQARATSCSSSEEVMSHTVSSHSSSICGHDYLLRDKLSTSSSIHLSVCLTGCQP